MKNCIKDSQRLDPSIIERLIDILEVNPYSSLSRNLSDNPNLKNHVTYIRSDVNLDQYVYNIPSIFQVTIIWVESDDSNQLKERDIVAFNKLDRSHIVQYYFGCYNLLQYLLLFLFGEFG